MPALPANWASTGNPLAAADIDTIESTVNAISAKIPVKVVATTTIAAGTYNNGTAGVGATYTVTASGATTIDGRVLAVGDKVLLAGQTSGVQNGVYNVTVAGGVGVSTVLTRVPALNSSADFPGAIISVRDGDTYFQTTWVCKSGTLAAPVIGSNDLEFRQPRYVKRVYSITSSSTIVADPLAYDVMEVTALAVSASIGVTDFPADYQELTLAIKDNGTAQNLSWNAQFEASGVVGSLPSATVAGKWMVFKAIYRASVGKMVVMAADTVGHS